MSSKLKRLDHANKVRHIYLGDFVTSVLFLTRNLVRCMKAVIRNAGDNCTKYNNSSNEERKYKTLMCERWLPVRLLKNSTLYLLIDFMDTRQQNTVIMRWHTNFPNTKSPQILPSTPLVTKSCVAVWYITTKEN